MDDLVKRLVKHSNERSKLYEDATYLIKCLCKNYPGEPGKETLLKVEYGFEAEDGKASMNSDVYSITNKGILFINNEINCDLVDEDRDFVTPDEFVSDETNGVHIGGNGGFISPDVFVEGFDPERLAEVCANAIEIMKKYGINAHQKRPSRFERAFRTLFNVNSF